MILARSASKPVRRLLRLGQITALAILFAVLIGCSHPSITAVNLNNPNEQEGIPYYLPKPYLIISKNIRYIPTPTVGLTGTVPIPATFDPSGTTSAGSAGSAKKSDSTSKGTNSAVNGGGAKKNNTNAVETAGGAGDGAGVKEGTSSGVGDASAGTPSGTVYGTQVFGPASIAVVPPASISDGLVPQEFYTYQIVYLPDLTQKYGLRIEGGAGEFRATENLVNGWMHTGPGPLYMRDSFTSQSVAASGQVAADVVQAVGQVALSAMGIPAIPGGANPNTAVQTSGEKPSNKIANYAQIYVFEQVLSEEGGVKTISWRQVKGMPISFPRDWIELERAASAAPDGAPLVQDNKDIDDYIQDKLANKGWRNITVRATLSDESMTVKVFASKANANGDALRSDTLSAAKEYVTEKMIPIPPGRIFVIPSIQ